MRRLAITGLPGVPSDAAAAFHGEWMPQAASILDPSRGGENLMIVFPLADHTHTGWRLAVVQSLAREFAPARINAVAGSDPAAIEAALVYLAGADGVTGQYLPLDSAGAGPVIPLPE
ncbi:MAG: Rossmann fold domain-containing protein [Novosphingobium sp.]